jgi:hypothetical protein
MGSPRAVFYGRPSYAPKTITKLTWSIDQGVEKRCDVAEDDTSLALHGENCQLLGNKCQRANRGAGDGSISKELRAIWIGLQRASQNATLAVIMLGYCVG